MDMKCNQCKKEKELKYCHDCYWSEVVEEMKNQIKEIHTIINNIKLKAK